MTMDRTLNGIMEIDHPIRVTSDGEIVDAAEVWAPNLLDGELDDNRWKFFSAGYTLQDSYHGPIMHNSEFIGGRLESDIRETPGVYVAIVAYWSSENDDDDETIVEGWAVVRLADEHDPGVVKS